LNPLAVLLPALNATLTAPPLLWQGSPVVVEQHLAGNSKGHYVLIEQPMAVDAGGSTACKRYACTALLDVVTQFRTDRISSRPAEEITSLLMDRLDSRRLALRGEGWECGPSLLEISTPLTEQVGSLVAVRRLLRYRWDVFYHMSTSAPAPVQLLGLPYRLPFALT
jgi:hypothetical protein